MDVFDFENTAKHVMVNYMPVAITSVQVLVAGVFVRITSINVRYVSVILVGFSITPFKENSFRTDFKSLLSHGTRKCTFMSPRTISSLDSTDAFVTIELNTALKSLCRYLEVFGGR